MNAYHIRFIVDRRIFQTNKFAVLPQSAPKTRVLSYDFVKQIFTHIFINHMIVLSPLVVDRS